MDKEVERYGRSGRDSYYLKIHYVNYYNTSTIEVSHGIYESLSIGDTTYIDIHYGGITNIAYSGTIIGFY